MTYETFSVCLMRTLQYSLQLSSQYGIEFRTLLTPEINLLVLDNKNVLSSLVLVSPNYIAITLQPFLRDLTVWLANYFK